MKKKNRIPPHSIHAEQQAADPIILYNSTATAQQTDGGLRRNKTRGVNKNSASHVLGGYTVRAKSCYGIWSLVYAAAAAANKKKTGERKEIPSHFFQRSVLKYSV